MSTGGTYHCYLLGIDVVLLGIDQQQLLVLPALDGEGLLPPLLGVPCQLFPPLLLAALLGGLLICQLPFLWVLVQEMELKL